jgi:hypothetical protein
MRRPTLKSAAIATMIGGFAAAGIAAASATTPDDHGTDHRVPAPAGSTHSTSSPALPSSAAATAEDRRHHGRDDHQDRGRHQHRDRGRHHDSSASSADLTAPASSVSATASHRGVEPGDDHGRGVEPGDDRGGIEPGDDHGREVEPGDDHGRHGGGHGDDDGGHSGPGRGGSDD